MSGVQYIEKLEQLKPFLNKKNVMEIVVRGKNQRIKAFQKVALNDLMQGEEKALMQEAMNILNKNSGLQEQGLKVIQNVAKIQNIGLLLNGLNLCATCAGFAIMYAKLDSMSAEINQQINQLGDTIRKKQDVYADFESNKVLADYQNMLDCRRRQKPYSEEKMRELVDREYNVLSLLVSTLEKDISADNSALIFSIISMLSMLTVSLRYYDEQYYFENKDVLGDNDVWHSAHNKWMSVYENLLSDWFIEKVQDCGMLKMNLNTSETDAYYSAIVEQVNDLKQEVEDNQELIITIGDPELLRMLRENNLKEVKEIIEVSFKEALKDAPHSLSEKTLENAMKQVAQIC